MIPELLQRLGELLPCVGEDGSSSVLPEKELYAALLERFPMADREIATCLICTRLLFNAIGALDPGYLEREEWRFVSYAARTAAVSVLRLLLRPIATGGILHHMFWTDSVEYAKDRRRVLEHLAEHIAKDAKEPAVRISHVSFGLIRCGDYFLCYERELNANDPDRVKKGDLVLPGGRLDIRDMPSSFSQEEKLRLLCSPEGLGHYAEQAHEHALHRELEEELSLKPDMYDITEFARFKPYRGCHGGGDQHAWTDTYIWLYEVILQPAAVTRLQPCFDRKQAGCWATAEELWQSHSRTGAKIFFDACRENLPAEELGRARDSFPFLQNPSELQKHIILSGNETLSASVAPCREEGKAGRLKNSRAVTLNDAQSQLLLALGLAQRTLAWPREEHLKEHGDLLQQSRPEECSVALGGLLLHSAALRKIYASLPTDILDCCFTGARYYRLCASIYFPSSLFFYSIKEEQQGNKLLVIHRKQMEIPLLGLQYPELHLECDLAEGPMDIFCGVDREGSYDTLRTAKDKLSGKTLADSVRAIGLFRIYDGSGKLCIEQQNEPIS